MKLTLITNLAYVSIGPVRTNTYALLIVDDGDDGLAPPGRRYLARGFGADSAWPVFDLALPMYEYKLDGDQLIFGDVVLDLWPSNPTAGLRGLDIQECSSYPHVWEAIPVLVRKYWRGSGFPSLWWGFK